jgi:protein gp37
MSKRLAGRCGYPKDEPFRVTPHPEKLDEPLHWKKPKRVFVCSMGDLFHKDTPEQAIRSVWNVIADCQQHTFIVLTKRPQWMRDFLSHYICLPNLWLGVSVWDQASADTLIPPLLQTPAAVRFVSYEPALGPVDFTNVGEVDGMMLTCLGGPSVDGEPDGVCIDWLICGGETGPGARPMHPDWARSARDQCQAAGVPYFFKQWGEWGEEASGGFWTGPKTRNYPGEGVSMFPSGQIVCREPSVKAGFAANRKAGFRCNDPYGPGLRSTYVKSDEERRWHQLITKVQQENRDYTEEERKFVHGYVWMFRKGKKLAGRLLDGREWNEFPKQS